MVAEFAATVNRMKASVLSVWRCSRSSELSSFVKAADPDGNWSNQI